jgi:hypothetical protein
MSRTTRNRVLGACGASALLLAGPAGADTYYVDRFDDSTASLCSPVIPNDCGLRGAILEANSNPGDDVVRLQAGTYILSIPGPDEDDGETGDLDVTDTLVIEGKGPELTAIDAGGLGGLNDRVLEARMGDGLEWLTLRGVTVTGGYPSTGEGGGIRVYESSVRLETCAVSGNHTPDGAGAAIYLWTILGSPSRVEVVDSWITNNVGLAGVLVASSLLLERSTVSFNACSQGAAVSIHESGPSSLVNSTIAENSGPGVDVAAPGVTMHGCTLADNSSMELWVLPSDSVTLSNTVIDGNCAVSGQLSSLGGNLESPGHTCGLGANDLEDVPSVGLSELGFFGGPAPVLKPQAGSPALDQAIAGWACSPLDQRGLSRPRDGDGVSGAVCDIGAVELAAPGEIFVETSECGFTTGWSEVVP